MPQHSTPFLCCVLFLWSAVSHSLCLCVAACESRLYCRCPPCACRPIASMQFPWWVGWWCTTHTVQTLLRLLLRLVGKHTSGCRGVHGQQCRACCVTSIASHIHYVCSHSRSHTGCTLTNEHQCLPLRCTVLSLTSRADTRLLACCQHCVRCYCFCTPAAPYYHRHIGTTITQHHPSPLSWLPGWLAGWLLLRIHGCVMPPHVACFVLVQATFCWCETLMAMKAAGGRHTQCVEASATGVRHMGCGSPAWHMSTVKCRVNVECMQDRGCWA